MKSSIKPISFAPPEILPEDIQAVTRVLRSGWITTGPCVNAFENALTEYCKAAGAVCTTSGTASLQSTLRLLEIGPGDEVITVPFTYTASASCIDHVGARIRLVDVDAGSFHLSPEKLSRAITRRTKAVIAVDYAGIPCDYRALKKVLNQKKHLYQPRSGTLQTRFKRPVLIADAAHSFGGMYQQKRVGAIADFSTFSFHAVKNLTTAEGGAILYRAVPGVSAKRIKELLYLIVMHGQDKDAQAKLRGHWRYDILFPGHKYNMTDIQAALGLSQLSRYARTLKRRKALCDRYTKKLQVHPRLLLPEHQTPHYESAYHLYPVRIEGLAEKGRDHLIDWMRGCGIATNVHFIPLPMHTAYQKKGFRIKHLPESYQTYQNLMTLPLHLKLSFRDVDRVAKALLSGLKSLGVT